MRRKLSVSAQPCYLRLGERRVASVRPFHLELGAFWIPNTHTHPVFASSELCRSTSLPIVFRLAQLLHFASELLNEDVFVTMLAAYAELHKRSISPTQS